VTHHDGPLDDEEPELGEPVVGDQGDEPWWKWAGVIPGRVLTGSRLSRHQRADIWSGIFAAGLVFLVAVAVVVVVVALVRST
jgi:hypothetical protein